ncbi:hypothetical protein SUGI_0564770 [Cryptomeria japonica]|nr:hypothetical protein SUGI_0564770 [Cryptomeria japonica]
MDSSWRNTDLDAAGGLKVSGYLLQDDLFLEMRSRPLLRETDPLGPAYDKYAQNRLLSYGLSSLCASDGGNLSEKEIHREREGELEKNRPLAGEEVDAMFPREGYNILDPPASHVLFRFS